MGTSHSEPTISMLLKLTNSFQVFESKEKDFFAELGINLLKSTFEETPQYRTDYDRGQVRVQLDVLNVTVFRFEVRKDGTIFIEHTLYPTDDTLDLLSIIEIFGHHTTKILGALELLSPDAVVGVAMKISKWPEKGLRTDAVFKCTHPNKSLANSSHWHVLENPKGVNFSDFFRDFLFDALENNSYRHFEETVRKLDINALKGHVPQSIRQKEQEHSSTIHVELKSKFDRIF